MGARGASEKPPHFVPISEYNLGSILHKKDVNESSNLISNSRGNPGFAFTTGSYRAERIRERIAHEPRSRTSRREESCLLPKEG